jgi:hypothetical protein
MRPGAKVLPEWTPKLRDVEQRLRQLRIACRETQGAPK